MSDMSLYEALNEVLERQRQQEKVLRLLCKMYLSGELADLTQGSRKKIIKYIDSTEKK